MQNRRPVNEDDLLLTEMLIAESYTKLKRSVKEVPSRALASVGKTIAEHPYASAATAIGAGAAMYGIFTMMSRNASSRNATERSRPRERGSSGPDLVREMLPMILPIVTPYITAYIRKYLGSIHAEKHE